MGLRCGIFSLLSSSSPSRGSCAREDMVEMNKQTAGEQEARHEGRGDAVAFVLKERETGGGEGARSRGKGMGN
uniref:Uncharacterized protein n=1 Tax=Chromera velia CCMP2878 TaxID=1169474 RepID=A0A0G4HJK4_9ALVE|eukprot:Cvel_28167.t1-p1 / transcript=Cvel_28167.t1 / gene=Cvel_28167 / organism=Chromera_velia_CCMP2878 / gene_product=hypothetical protein / transcript_product=hypothetical protein / location=Cvel_scaffold3639:13907-14122(-) / protein_length=72 / sequence_SO=supercontig / SO=protein_coding / is_pseudo=false